MKFLVTGKGVAYGVNGSDVAITDVANVDTLKEGSILMVYTNGSVVKADGSFTDVAGEHLITYTKINGELLTMTPVATGHSKVRLPLPDHAPAAKVVTFDVTLPNTVEFENHSGISFINAADDVMNPNRRDDVTVYTDDESVQADVTADILAKVKELDFVATATAAVNVITITYIEGVNYSCSGLGELERVTETVTTGLSLGDSLTMEETMKFAKDASSQDGNRDSSIDGIIGTFTKDYGIGNYRYLIYGIETDNRTYSTGKTDIQRYGAVEYIGIPEGDVPGGGISYAELFAYATSGVPFVAAP